MSTTLAEKPAAAVARPRLDEPVAKHEGAPATQAATIRPLSRRWGVVVALVLMASGGAAWHFRAAIAGAIASAKGESQSIADTKSEKREGKANLGFAASSAAGGGKQAKAARIETVPVQVAERSDILRLTGSLIADEKSFIASNTSGIAAEVRVDRGSFVRKNDVLVQIDPTDAKNKLAEGQAMLDELKARLGLEGDLTKFNPEDQPEVRLAKASAELAASNFRRSQEMYARKVVTTEAYDQTRTEFELATQRYKQALLLIKQAMQVCKTATARLAILEKAVADTTIRAPFDGWVAEKLVAVGEQISSGMQATKVVTLVRVDPLRLSLTVPQQDVAAVQLGESVRFRVDSFPDRTFTATVRYIAPMVANDTRSMVVEAVVPNKDSALRPGMFATAELMLPKKGARVLAPVSAVQKLGEVARVFVLRDGVAREQVVALGEIDGGKVEIRSGLSGKEKLVAHPEAVRDGDGVAQR